MKAGIVPPMTAPVFTDEVGSPVAKIKHKILIGFGVMNILCMCAEIFKSNQTYIFYKCTSA